MNAEQPAASDFYAGGIRAKNLAGNQRTDVDEEKTRSAHLLSSKLAWSIAVLSWILMAAGLLLSGMAVAVAGYSVGLFSHLLTVPFSGAIFAVMGAMVLSRYPRHPIAWMLSGLGLLSGVELLDIGVLTYASLQAPGEIIPAPALAHWLIYWLWIPQTSITLTLLILLFPDGRLPSKHWRPIGWAAGFGVGLAVINSAFTGDSTEALGGILYNPFAIQSPLLLIAGSVAFGLLAFAFVGSVVSIGVRFRRSSGIERQQLKWMIYALALVVLMLALSMATYIVVPNVMMATEISSSLIGLSMIGIALAASIAVLRYRLYNINPLINRTLVYGALTVTIIAIYMLSVSVLSVLFQAEGSPIVALIATGIVAVLFQPHRDRLQRGVNRLFYGQRDEPLRALYQLGQRLEAAITPETVLPTLVETISQTLKLPYVAISLYGEDGFKIVAQSGANGGNTIRIPLIYQGETVGQLIAGPRRPDELFSPADRQLLENIAHQAGPAVYAVQLTDELRQSRVRLVSTREEERRRMRRDLHDGLGPILASQGLKIAAVSQLIDADPDKARQLLEKLASQNEVTVAEVRRLIYELRPIALDDLGLVGAVRDYTAGLRAGAQTSLRLKVDVHAPPSGLPILPAAIEVAAYRIATEALTNVARHAHARRAVVSFDLLSNNRVRMLHLEIVDDGIGVPENQRTGIGMISMRERAEEVGGNLKIESGSGQGTRVTADLPLVDVN